MTAPSRPHSAASRPPIRALATPRPAPGARLRLVCLPFAGGGAAVYRPLALGFGPDVEVSALQLPGREQRFREPLLRSIAAMTDDALAAIAPFQDRPLVLFGHSMGAIIAYETARRLAARGGPQPAGVIVSGRAAPGAPRPSAVLAHRFDDDGFIAHLRDLNGTPDEVLAEPELMQIVLPILRADFEAIETWRPPETPTPLACPVLALAGDRDPDAGPDAMAGWRDFAAGDFEAETFAGDHFFVTAAPDAVSARIARWLARPGMPCAGSDHRHAARESAP